MTYNLIHNDVGTQLQREFQLKTIHKSVSKKRFSVFILHRKNQSHCFYLLKKHCTIVDYLKVWHFFVVDQSVFSYFCNLVVLLRNYQFLYLFSANVSGEEIESDTIVNTGVISLSTNPKITRTFEEPVVITLQYNQVRISLEKM